MKMLYINTIKLLSISMLFFFIGCVSSRKYDLALDEIARMRVDSTVQAKRMATIAYEKESELADAQNQLRLRTARLDSLEKFASSKKKEFDQLSNELLDAIPDYDENKLETYLENGYLHISLPHRILFNRGEDYLTDNGKKIVQQISDNLKGIQADIMILGHTDNVPYVASSKDNWELSFERAHAVMDLMVKNGVAANQIIVAGRSKYDTAMKNETQIGQLLNRRIELVLMPDMEKLENIVETYLE